MYDDGEEYAQGVQALQDQIMAQGQGKIVMLLMFVVMNYSWTK